MEICKQQSRNGNMQAAKRVKMRHLPAAERELEICKQQSEMEDMQAAKRDLKTATRDLNTWAPSTVVRHIKRYGRKSGREQSFFGSIDRY